MFPFNTEIMQSLEESNSKIENLRKVMTQINDKRKLADGKDSTVQENLGEEDINFADFEPLFESFESYKEFCEHVLVWIVSKTKMSEVGKLNRHGKRNTFTDIVTVSDEQFALMILDDRWQLWEAIAAKRVQGKNANDGTPFDADDDMRLCDVTKEKINGTNKTRYSVWGKYCPNHKGFGNGYAAMTAMDNSLRKGDDPLYWRTKSEGKALRKRIEVWWNAKHGGGRKRAIHSNGQNKKKKKAGLKFTIPKLHD